MKPTFIELSTCVTTHLATRVIVSLEQFCTVDGQKLFLLTLTELLQRLPVCVDVWYQNSSCFIACMRPSVAFLRRPALIWQQITASSHARWSNFYHPRALTRRVKDTKEMHRLLTPGAVTLGAAKVWPSPNPQSPVG